MSAFIRPPITTPRSDDGTRAMLVRFIRRCGARVGFAWAARAVIAAAALLAVPERAPAATLIWGTSGTGGTGNWDLSNSPGWWNGTSNIAWVNTNNDIASFGGTAGTVALTTGITTNGLTFATTGYLVTGGTLTFAGTTPTITANTGVTGTVDSILAGGTGVTKAGAGTLTLGAAQTLTGDVTVAEGTLRLIDGNAFASASRILVASGAILDTPGLAIVNDQTLGGYGTVHGDVTLDPGGIVSPGGSIGNLTVDGGVTFSGTSAYKFEVTNAVLGITPGVDWDLLTATSLTIAATPQDPFRIQLTSLTSAIDENPGSMFGNWDPDSVYQWLFVTTGATISSFDAAAFTIDQTNFSAYNATNGFFSVVRGDSLGMSDTDLYIVYSPVPEPGTLALAAIGLAAVGLATSRRRSRGPIRAEVVGAGSPARLSLPKANAICSSEKCFFPIRKNHPFWRSQRRKT